MGPWLIDVRTRDEFDTWLGDAPPTPVPPVVMIVQGDSPEVREFLPNALDAAKRDDRRVVVWVKDRELLSLDEVREFFLSDDSILAAVLSEDHQVRGWVYRDRTGVDDADFAYHQAGG
jgi:hypothetical protein